MSYFIQKLFAPPTFPNDDEKTRVAKILNTLLIVLFFLPVMGAVNLVFLPTNVAYLGPILIFVIVSLIGLMITLRRGYVQASSTALIIILLVAFGYLIYSFAGEARPLLTIIVSLIIIGGLLLGTWGAIITSLGLIAITGVVTYLAANGSIIAADAEATPLTRWLVVSSGYLACGMLLTLASSSLQDALRQARANQDNLLKSNRDLQETQNTLEQRVAQRTSELQEQSDELTQLSQRLEKRATGLQAVAQVGRTITSIDKLDELLPRITRLISEQFDYYHIGIFLLNKNGSYAVLSASNSSGGQKMLSQGHRVKVGEAGIVGYVSSSGRPHRTTDTGSEAVVYNYPELPETRSEMALPLKVSGEIIGVLDVHSTDVSAFKNEDAELFSILADQVSIAIQNARRFEETQKSTADAQAITQQYVRQEWQSASEDETIGYRFSQAGIQPIVNAVKTTTTSQVAVPELQTRQDMLIPIKLHDQVIGNLRLQSKLEHKWDQDTVDIAQAVADRVALAVENARLLERSQSQAARERTVSEITAKIGATVNMRNVLQTAVEELGRALPGSDVVIQIESKK